MALKQQGGSQCGLMGKGPRRVARQPVPHRPFFHTLQRLAEEGGPAQGQCGHCIQSILGHDLHDAGPSQRCLHRLHSICRSPGLGRQGRHSFSRLRAEGHDRPEQGPSRPGQRTQHGERGGRRKTQDGALCGARPYGREGLRQPIVGQIEDDQSRGSRLSGSCRRRNDHVRPALRPRAGDTGAGVRALEDACGHGVDGTRPLALVEEALFEQALAFLRRHLHVLGRQKEHFVGHPLHAPIQGVGETAGEVDEPL